MNKFINPYNFIPLSGKIKNESSYINNSDNTLSGVIEYSLLTKTPLFIPNTSNDKALDCNINSDGSEYHKSYEFFSYDNLSDLKKKKSVHELKAPVIPGSEIRGMLRSNYEILTNSCLSSMEDAVLSRRTCQIFEPGLIKYVKGNTENQGHYVIYKAKDCILRTKDKNNLEIEKNWKKEHNNRKCYVQEGLKEGQEVYVSIEQKGRKNVVLDLKYDYLRDNYETGYVIKGEEGLTKHCCHIFVPDDKVVCELPSLDALYQTIHSYQANDNQAYKEYENQLTEFVNFSNVNICNKEENNKYYFPVYYSQIKGHCYLSCASITREVYKKTIKDIVGNHFACTDINKLCPACLLFGTVVMGKNRFSSASRIRLSDMVVDDTGNMNELYDNEITLKELSSPKLSNTEFYLKRPKGAKLWTYDYCVKGENVESAFSDYNYTAEINGRKFYWHNLKIKYQDISQGESTIRNVTIRPVKRSVIFHGKLFFDKITEKELQQLIYLIEAGDFENIDKKRHGYKIGMGKPLGLGSVALSIDRVVLRKVKKDDEQRTILNIKEKYQINNENRFEKLFNTNDKELEENYSIMTDFYALDRLLEQNYVYSYPYKKNKVYEWFRDNHKAYNIKKDCPIAISSTFTNNRNQQFFSSYMKAMKPVLEHYYVKQKGRVIEFDEKNACGKISPDNISCKIKFNARDIDLNNIELKKGVDIAFICKKEKKTNQYILSYGILIPNNNKN